MRSITPSEINVAILAGGSSGEREISLQSGLGAEKALNEAGFKTRRLDPASKEELAELMSGEFDIAFLCLHGKGGEDGSIQGFLETIDMPYTCSGVFSSALSIDKDKSKIMYREAGLPTPFAVTLFKGDPLNEQKLNEVKFPSVVKPATEGSALGVYIVNNSVELKKAVDKVFTIDNEILIESYVSGTEVTAAVLGNDNPTALPVIEIVPTHDFYDFESKYAPGGSQHICPARLSDELTVKIQDLAVKSHEVLGCSGVSRTDMIIDADGNPWILETNTIPGMTETSLLPDAGRAAGMEFPELCTKLIEYALEAKRV
jgi:D-alanine-D-alanine ligase